MRGTAPGGSADKRRRTKSWVLGANAMVAGSGRPRSAATPRCTRRDQRPEDRLPFGIGEARRVGERVAVGGAGGVRPVMMTVRGEVDAPRRGGAELGEMAAQVEGHAGGLAV